MNLVYVVDPFGCVRAYSETLVSNLRGQVSARLLTTGLTLVRGPIDCGDNTVERFFLRYTIKVKTLLSNTPTWILQVLGLVEYCFDLFRLRGLRSTGATFHWQWIVNALTVPLLCLFGIPVDVLTVHDLIPSGQLDRTKIPWISLLPLRLSKIVVFHSAKLESEAIALAPFLVGKTQVVPHGLLFEGEWEVKKWSSIQTIGVLGLLKDYKGLEVLLRAWRSIYPQLESKDVRLRIVGDCRLGWRSKRSLLAMLRSTPGVDWHFGYLPEDEFKSELVGLDLLVLPYTHCAQSGVALAAFGLGVPLLVSDAGALPELLEGGQEKWVFKAGDRSELALKLNEFIDLESNEVEEYRAWIGVKSQLYSKDVIVKRHLEVYDLVRQSQRQEVPASVKYI